MKNTFYFINMLQILNCLLFFIFYNKNFIILVYLFSLSLYIIYNCRLTIILIIITTKHTYNYINVFLRGVIYGYYSKYIKT